MEVVDFEPRPESRLDCGSSFCLHEFELLEAIASGQTGFDREHSPNLDDIDGHLQTFEALGYVDRVVRAVYPNQEDRLMRVDVPGGLTPVGEARRRQLLARFGQVASGVSWETPRNSKCSGANAGVAMPSHSAGLVSDTRAVQKLASGLRRLP